jgi:hypothetical protein
MITQRLNDDIHVPVLQQKSRKWQFQAAPKGRLVMAEMIQSAKPACVLFPGRVQKLSKPNLRKWRESHGSV